jgi:hypothetical protein
VNKGKEKDQSVDAPVLLSIIRSLWGLTTTRRARLVDEVEGAYHLVATRFEAHLAPNTSVVLRAPLRASTLLDGRPGSSGKASTPCALISLPAKVYVYEHCAMWAFSEGSSAGSVTTQKRSMRSTFSFPLSL